MADYTRTVTGGTLTHRLHFELENDPSITGATLEEVSYKSSDNELKIKYDDSLSTAAETAMDVVINAHDPTTLSNGEISPPQLTNNVNDWDPDNILESQCIRISSDADGNEITGIAHGSEIRQIKLFNIGPKKFKIKHNNGLSLSQNRILCTNSSDLTVELYGVLTLDWFPTDAKWVITSYSK